MPNLERMHGLRRRLENQVRTESGNSDNEEWDPGVLGLDPALQDPNASIMYVSVYSSLTRYQHTHILESRARFNHD